MRSGFFPQPRIDAGHDGRGSCGLWCPTCYRSCRQRHPPTTTSGACARAVDDRDGLVFARLMPGVGLAAGSQDGGSSTERAFRPLPPAWSRCWATGLRPRGLSVKSAMLKNGPGTAEQYGQRLHGRRTQPETRRFPALSVLSWSGVLISSPVSVIREPPRRAYRKLLRNQSERRYHDGLGSSACAARKSQRADTAGKQVPADKKGRPEGRPFITDIAFVGNRLSGSVRALCRRPSAMAWSPVAGAGAAIAGRR